jgi:hypothetical protein
MDDSKTGLHNAATHEKELAKWSQMSIFNANIVYNTLYGLLIWAFPEYEMLLRITNGSIPPTQLSKSPE